MGNSGTAYRPCASVTVDCVTPVPAFFTSIFPPATTAPELSVTVPEMVAVTCALKAEMPTILRRRTRRSVETEHFLVLPFEFIETPFRKRDGIGDCISKSKQKSSVRLTTALTLGCE